MELNLIDKYIKYFKVHFENVLVRGNGGDNNGILMGKIYAVKYTQ